MRVAVGRAQQGISPEGFQIGCVLLSPVARDDDRETIATLSAFYTFTAVLSPKNSYKWCEKRTKQKAEKNNRKKNQDKDVKRKKTAIYY